MYIYICIHIFVKIRLVMMVLRVWTFDPDSVLSFLKRDTKWDQLCNECHLFWTRYQVGAREMGVLFVRLIISSNRGLFQNIEPDWSKGILWSPSNPLQVLVFLIHAASGMMIPWKPPGWPLWSSAGINQRNCWAEQRNCLLFSLCHLPRRAAVSSGPASCAPVSNSPSQIWMIIP